LLIYSLKRERGQSRHSPSLSSHFVNRLWSTFIFCGIMDRGSKLRATSILHTVNSTYHNLAVGDLDGKAECYKKYVMTKVQDSGVRREIPMHLIPIVLHAASNPALTAADIRTITLLARYGDQDGVVGNDEASRTLTDPRVIAPIIEAGASTVGKALQHLERHGYIEWQRGRHLRSNLIRIVLPSHAA
jgi:hypothetical protein